MGIALTLLLGGRRPAAYEVDAAVAGSAYLGEGEGETGECVRGEGLEGGADVDGRFGDGGYGAFDGG